MTTDFLKGAIDLHVHSGPDQTPRLGTAIDFARKAAEAGMRAMLFKDHYFPSYIKAALAQQVVPEMQLFGGITLNGSVGGLRTHSVKAAIKAGAKQVMFPTFDSVANVTSPHRSKLQVDHLCGEEPVAIPVVREGKLVPAAEEILRILVDNPHVVLSTGHLGPEEGIPLVERARELGITQIVVEHPNGSGSYTLEHMQRLAAAGALLNLSYNAYHSAMGRRDPREAVEIVRTVGAEHCALMTDGGQPYNAWPHETMRIFCEILSLLGLSDDELHTMTKTVPARLLRLDPDPVYSCEDPPRR